MPETIIIYTRRSNSDSLFIGIDLLLSISYCGMYWLLEQRLSGNISPWPVQFPRRDDVSLSQGNLSATGVKSKLYKPQVR